MQPRLKCQQEKPGKEKAGYTMQRLNFDRINRARKLLGLCEKATLKEIKEAYRNKVKECHPDKYPHQYKEKYERMSAGINEAYKTIHDYVEEYAFSFREQDVKHNLPDRDVVRFFGDWLQE